MPIQPGNKTPRFQSILPLAVSVVSKQSNPQLMRIGFSSVQFSGGLSQMN